MFDAFFLDWVLTSSPWTITSSVSEAMRRGLQVIPNSVRSMLIAARAVRRVAAEKAEEHVATDKPEGTQHR